MPIRPDGPLSPALIPGGPRAWAHGAAHLRHTAACARFSTVRSRLKEGLAALGSNAGPWPKPHRLSVGLGASRHGGRIPPSRPAETAMSDGVLVASVARAMGC